MNTQNTTAPTDDMTLTRVLNAPRELVFEAWTNPQYVEQWFGPNGFTITATQWESRAGGGIQIAMKAPDGTVYPMGGSFVEVTPPSTLVFKSVVSDAAGTSIFEILNTVTFAEEGGKTKLTVHAHVLSKRAGADQYLKGQVAGWKQTVDRLEAFVAGQAR